MVLDPLAPVIGQFRRRYPKVRVRIVQADRPEEVRDAVRSGAAELGLTDELAEANRDVVGELVAEQEMVVVLPPGSPPPPGGVLPLQVLLDMNLIARPYGTQVRDLVTDEGARRGQEVQPTIEITPRGSALYLAVAGAGAAVLPRPVAELGLSRGVRLASLCPRQTRQVYLLRRVAPLSPAASAIRALLESAHMQQESAAPGGEPVIDGAATERES
jgi:LysR family transcriptional regulator, carnitine catabolism transcriptional activator